MAKIICPRCKVNLDRNLGNLDIRVNVGKGRKLPKYRFTVKCLKGGDIEDRGCGFRFNIN